MWEMFDVCSDRVSVLGEQAKGGRGVRVGRARAPREAKQLRFRVRWTVRIARIRDGVGGKAGRVTTCVTDA